MVAKCNSLSERFAFGPVRIRERLIDHDNLRPVRTVLPRKEAALHKWYAQCAEIVPRGHVVPCSKILVQRRLSAFDRKAGVVVPTGPGQITAKSGTAYARNRLKLRCEPLIKARQFRHGFVRGAWQPQ